MGPLQRSSVMVLTALCIAALCMLCTSPAKSDAPGGASGQQTGEQSSSSYLSIYPLPISDPNASPIVCMKRLPDGAHVCINRRCITRIAFDHIYVEEADRSAGVRIVFTDFYPLGQIDRGNLVSVSGELGTADGERVIYSRSEFTCDVTARVPISALGMATSAILGWPSDFQDPDGSRVTGLLPFGLVVKIWGKVSGPTGADGEGYFSYIDDGWGKKDGSEIGQRGVRVYSNRICMPDEFLIALGVLSTKMFDPTPQGPNGDELVLPVIRCNGDQDPYYPPGDPTSMAFGQVSGRVRLVGEPPPGRTVRIYSQNSAVLVDHVTDAYKPFTLSGIPDYDPNPSPPIYGGLISASTTGYLSDSRNAAAGDTNVDFDLQTSAVYMEVKSSLESIATCGSEQALISVLFRDCEGKGIPNRQVKLTTTKGAFVESPEHPNWITLMTDCAGFATAHLTAGQDNAGIAVVEAADEPGRTCSSQVSIILRGPDITMSIPKYLSAGGTSAITAVVSEAGTPIPGAAVSFRTDLGVFQESGTWSYSTTADGFGTARCTLALGSPGTARVLATYTNPCGQKTVGWTVVAYKSAPWHSRGVEYSNPLVVDLDGNANGKKECVIVTTDGDLTALTATGGIYWQKIMHLPGSNSPSCVVLDTERSGKPCIFIPAESLTKLFAFAHDGSPLAGWPAGTNYRFIHAAAAIGDVNLDGTPEIVAGDESCYVFSWNPTGDWRRTGTWDSSFLWRNLTASSSTTIYNTTCALGSFVDQPGQPQRLDVFCGSNSILAFFGFPGDLWGDFVSSPVYLDNFPKATGGRVETSPAIGDIDGDGKNDLAVGSDDGNLYILSSKLGTWRGYPTGGTVKSSPAMVDLDGDEELDAVVVGSDSGRLFAFDYQGQAPPGWDGGIKLNTGGDYAIESSPIAADVLGIGSIQIIVGCNDGNIYAVYPDGFNHQTNGVPTSPIAWVRCCIPLTETTAQVLCSPVADDIDNDGKFELLGASDKGVYLFQFNGPYDPANHAQHPWPTFHADNQRTGCATVPPPLVKASILGIVTRADQPVTNAFVSVYHQDGSLVYQPHSDPPVARVPVQTVGSTDPAEKGKGAYCISQLEPDTTYKIKVEVAGQMAYWVENIAVTTGKTVVDVVLP